MSDNAPVYRLKRLAWKGRDGEHVAYTPLRDFKVWAYRHNTGRFVYTVYADSLCLGCEYESLEAAQAAAQAWYDARMIEGLEEVKPC